MKSKKLSRPDTCQVRRCPGARHIIFYGKGVCEAHWQRHSREEIDLKAEFGIPKEKHEDCYHDDRDIIKTEYDKDEQPTGMNPFSGGITRRTFSVVRHLYKCVACGEEWWTDWEDIEGED